MDLSSAEKEKKEEQEKIWEENRKKMVERKKLELEEKKKKNMYSKMPETVFVFITTHGGIPLSKNEKSGIYSYKPVQLPDDLILYRINSAAPGVCNLAEKDWNKELIAVLDRLNSYGKNRGETNMSMNRYFYEALKKIPEFDVNWLAQDMQDELKELYISETLNPLKKKKKKGKKFTNFDYKPIYEQGANIFKMLKIKKEGKNPGITYDKSFSYQYKDDQYPRDNKILALNYFKMPTDPDDPTDDYFDLFEYLFDNDDEATEKILEKKEILLSEVIKKFYELGAKKIVLIDFSCFAFYDVKGDVIPNTTNALQSTSASALVRSSSFKKADTSEADTSEAEEEYASEAEEEYASEAQADASEAEEEDASEAEEEIDSSNPYANIKDERRFPVPERDERELRRKLNKQVYGIKNKEGDVIGGRRHRRKTKKLKKKKTYKKNKKTISYRKKKTRKNNRKK